MQNLLEAYLTQLERRLRPLPREQRAQEIDEIRRHLESLIDARIGAGLSEQEAVTEAIRQFGEPKAIGKSLVRTWRRAHRSLIDNLLVAPLIMQFLRILLSLVGTLICYLTRTDMTHLYPPTQYSEVRINLCLDIVGYLGAFAIGWFVQTIAPRRALWAVLFCVGLDCALWAILCVVFKGVSMTASEAYTACKEALFAWVLLWLGTHFAKRHQVDRARKYPLRTTATEGAGPINDPAGRAAP